MHHIIIRSDAALHIGTGHVMRCLTLANALKQKGATINFICREHEGHLASVIREQGHQCYLLPRPSQPVSKHPDLHLEPPHAQWLGEAWQNDVQQTKAVLANQYFDWLIVDHYALDARWEMAMRDITDGIMVIDDLADRKHDCDLLLDQTLGRKENDYEAKVPENCTILTGSLYALLRPEFSQWREYSLARREQPVFKSLLVNLGGIDNTNITGKVLDVLARCTLPDDLKITIVMGLTAPYLTQVQEQAKQMPVTTDVMVNVSNMAEIMAKSDLAIGAAGSTSWERCCLGLPSLMLILADNQKNTANALEKAGAIMTIKIITEIIEIMQRIIASPDILQKMSEAARDVVNGNGVAAVVEHLEKHCE